MCVGLFLRCCVLAEDTAANCVFLLVARTRVEHPGVWLSWRLRGFGPEHPEGAGLAGGGGGG